MAALLDEAHLCHLRELRARPATIDDEGLRLGDTYVMFFAESGLMAEHAAALIGGRCGADVLEVGLGLGVFAQQLAPLAPASYTAVEPHPAVVNLVAPRVRTDLPCPVTIVVEPWQALDLESESVDAIMYDTWPPDGYADADFTSFVEQVAVPALRPAGRFSFFHSGSRMSEARARVLDEHFPGWSATSVTIPSNRLPTGWTKPTGDFLVPCAQKGVR
ncbi:class I SAM-dependent methyltransferase [Micromonospora noduli]|uniref:class I SAM-dependent methyltransferase n=1 Tax=Micromonospora noduli TaxID=709876 RepID=UPI00343536A1